MDVSPADPPVMAMDLSKGYSVPPLTFSHTEVIDLAQKPEWYHRTDLPSPFRPRASSSYNSVPTRLHPEPSGPPPHLDLDQRSESIGNYINASVTRGLDLYCDGVHGNLWHPGFYGSNQTGGPDPESSGGEESDSGSDVIFLVSSAKEPLLCASLSPEGSSLEAGSGCCQLAPHLSSPSPDSSYSEDSSDSSVDIPVHHTRPIVLLSDLKAVFSRPADSPDVSSDDSDVIEVSVTKEKEEGLPFPPPPQGGGDTAPARGIRRSARFRKSLSEASSPCRAFRHRLRRRAKNDAVGIYNESCDSDDVLDHAVRLSSDEANEPATNQFQADGRSQPRPKALQSLGCKGKTPLAVSTTKRFRKQKRKTLSEHRPQSKPAKPVRRRRKKRRSQTGGSVHFSPREPEIQLRYANVKEKKDRRSGGFSPFIHMEATLCTVVNCQEEAVSVRRGQQTASTPRPGYVPNTSCFQLSRFGSDRPLARLLCCLCGQTANAMGLGDLHGPYRATGLAVDLQGPYQATGPDVDLQGPSQATVPDVDLQGPYRATGPDVDLQGPSRATGPDVDLQGPSQATSPSVDPHGPSWATGPSVDIQDPYRATGQAVDLQGPSRITSPSVDPQGRSWATSPSMDLQGPSLATSPSVDPQGLSWATGPAVDLQAPYRSTCPAVDWQRQQQNQAECLHVNGYAVKSTGPPPEAPGLQECWIHEDCGVWSAGVFLVRGKLYGLEEAAQLAQQTTCSVCQQSGAIMGCFQKGCPRNYHFRCAVQSGCVLNEDNFSVRCPGHKNKLLTVSRHHR
ncbi:transcription factor 20-like [Antennarius striatus]|uniref:transcription factor 20-like n=1 Tax=Antennarius striatus TaxID=241820 RepID=UPI0035ADF0F8